MYRPIEDYAVIGNLRSAVLVSKDGSIDWASAPFIDSPSIFGALLDDEKGGYWNISPTEPYTSTQKYIDETNVLITTFRSESGTLEVIDFLPIEIEKHFPAEEDTTFKIKRKVTCKHGSCNFTVDFSPKFNYARGETELTELDGGILAKNGLLHGVLVSHQPFAIKGDHAIADVTLSENESDFFVFRYNAGTVDVAKDNNIHHNQELSNTITYWRNWASQCDLTTCPIEKPWHEEVIRSALILKILFFEPIGTVAAAATTSLPEEIGGVRNWDYRFTWLRDSAFVFEAFFQLGHVVEAENYLSWLIDKCQINGGVEHPENIKIMYGLRDDNTMDEEVLTHLKGYKDSQPVRIGNAAHDQDQWDIYGSIMNMIWKLYKVRGASAVSESMWSVLSSIADYVVTIWREPDEGLWEVRGGKDHFVYSKVMCWVALDRACKLRESCALRGDVATWEKEKEAIKKEVYERGWSEKLQSFTQSYDSENLDAALLLLSAVGFIKGDDPKMLSTIEAIEKNLACEGGMLRRYSSADGLPGGEGAFLLSSFWLVDAYTRAHKSRDAHSLFNTLLEKGNHVKLYSEEIDPKTGTFLGNFPQAYTHIGLINSAYLLAESVNKQPSF